MFTEISPESVIADTGRGVIVGLAPPLDTPHGGTRVLIYKMNPPKNYKNLFTWNKKVMIISSTLGITACKLNWLNEEVFLKKKKWDFSKSPN